MASQFETSFVPQQPLLKVEGMTQRPNKPLNIPLVIALIVFFVTLATSAGVYFYKEQTIKQVAAKGEQLKAAEQLFSVDKVNEYKNLQIKLTAAKALVDSHLIFSVIFDLIETKAAENIGLTSLGFGQDALDTSLTLTGQAPSYEAVYFQVQKWRESKPVVKNVEVTSLSLEQTSGIVSFGVKMTLDPSVFSNKTVLAARGASTKVTTTAPETSPLSQPATTTTKFSTSTILTGKSTTTK